MRVFSRNAIGCALSAAAMLFSIPAANAGTILDCDTNGLIDSAEISQRAELDLNTNGRIDDCERMTGGICPQKIDPDGEQTDPINPLRPVPGTPSDQDADGVADCPDHCPYDPNKTQPGACGCGFRDEDFDGDGIADCIDNCPTSFNPDQADVDGNGRGDGCQLTIACPADVTVAADAGGGAAVTYLLPEILNAAGSVNVTAEPPSGTWFPIGMTTVTYEVTDESDQRGACSFVVTVTASGDDGEDGDDDNSNGDNGNGGTGGDVNSNGGGHPDGSTNGDMGGGVSDGGQAGDDEPPAGQVAGDCVINRDLVRLGVMLAFRAPVCGMGCLMAVPLGVAGCIGLRSGRRGKSACRRLAARGRGGKK